MASIIVIDDFFSDPNFIRQQAFNMEWYDQKGNHPGRRTDAELNFYKNVRNNMVSHLNEIQAYDRGQRRFSKQYYNKLIRQLNRMTGMTFDYKSGIDNSQDILEEILK